MRKIVRFILKVRFCFKMLTDLSDTQSDFGDRFPGSFSKQANIEDSMNLNLQYLLFLLVVSLVGCGSMSDSTSDSTSRESSSPETLDTSSKDSKDPPNPPKSNNENSSDSPKKDANNGTDNRTDNSAVDKPQNPSSIAGCYKASAFICKVEALISSKTNKYRASQGRSPLTHDEKFSFAARDWSQKQGVRGSIGHDGFPSARNAVYKTEFGVSPSFSGENVAMTSGIRITGEDDASAEKIAETFAVMWWNSSGHRANMLRSGFTSIGNGVYQNARGAWYATQLFK